MPLYKKGRWKLGKGFYKNIHYNQQLRGGKRLLASYNSSSRLLHINGKRLIMTDKNTRYHKQPRILMLIGSLGPGGKERQLILLLKELHLRSDMYIALAVMNSDSDQVREAKCYVDELLILKRCCSVDIISPFFALIKLVKKSQIQIIHTWGSGVWDLLGLLVSTLCGISLLHNGVRSSPEKMSFSNFLSKSSAYFANKVVANSYAGLRAFKLDGHPRAEVVYNGLELQRFINYDFANIKHQITMVANFRKEKDHQTLLSALSQIRKVYPDIKLLLIGHDFGTLTEIKRTIGQKELSSNVELITDCFEPAPYIASSVVCVLSTHGEGVSNVLLEYMALSKPVIVSNNGGNPEVVIDNVTGFLVPPGSSELMAEKILQLLNHPKQAELMGKSGRKLVIDKFSVDQMVGSYQEIYQGLVNRKLG
jgi:glycosyltransferase involved in cell wall biosynthesis